MKCRPTAPFPLIALAALLAACSAANPPESAAPAQRGQAPLFTGIGQKSRPITTRSALAQTYFDQGFALIYAFNHAEAERSFLEAARLDPECGMCWWGASLVVGMNINAAMDPEAAPRAWAALQEARRAPRASDRERAYVDALGRRYVDHPVDDRAPLEAAYALAMRELAARYPDDLDAATLAAEAILNLKPWQWYGPYGEPAEGTPEAVALLESVLHRDPDHVGAIHYYIHATEGSKAPERATPFADRLGALAPGAGHLVHMPSHTYFQIGRYHDALVVNQRAEEADNRYVAQCHAQGVYPLAYIPHNPHFGWAAAAMAGESAAALAMADATVRHTDHDHLRTPGLTTLQHFSVIPIWARTRFGRWQEILAMPPPPSDLVYPQGVWVFARGLASARLGQLEPAAAELARLREIAADPALEKVTVWDINGTPSLLAIGVRVLAGEIALARGDHGAAVAELRAAAALEDALRYNEPPDWHFPVRHTLGVALLAAGQPAEGEKVYREDLEVYPENGWALFGLAKALSAQGRVAESAEVRARFTRAWAHADVELSGSRL